MVHLYNFRNSIDTVFYATLTFFIAPYLLVQKFNIITMKHVKDPCQTAFVIGFLISIVLWNMITKKNVY